MCKIKLYNNICTHFVTEEVKSEVSYKNIKFPYYPSRVNSVTPIGEVDLDTFINSHKNPKEDIIKVFRDIEAASEAGDEETKAKLKQTKLFYFTPTVKVTRRDYSNIQSFNPIMVAEYDKVGEEVANKLKKAIFNRFKSCICAYLSPSKQGVKFLFKIPIVKSVEEYKEYFYGLAYYLKQVSGFDMSNQNPVLPLFLSYDFDMLIRDEAEIEDWVTRGLRLDSFKIAENLGDYQPREHVTEEERSRVEYIVRFLIKKCDEEQVGHPNVRSAGLVAGGYVGAGYFSEEEIYEILEDEILASEYLSKGVSGYLKTVRDMIVRGTLAPLELED